MERRMGNLTWASLFPKSSLITSVLVLVTQSGPTLWTVVGQAPLPMGFSRQGCWSGLPCPSPGALPDPEIEPGSPMLQADSLPSEPLGKPSQHKFRLDSSGQFSRSVLPIFWNPMDCSTPGFPVHQKLPEVTQTHVHQDGDAIQPSHPLSSPSPPAFNLSQH